MLETPSNDIRLPLQDLVNMAYENGRYGNEIDYSLPPVPPLEADDAAWIEKHLSKLST